ncbi:hypothetical protein ACOMHN_037469 [Nucella lapillus]
MEVKRNGGEAGGMEVKQEEWSTAKTDVSGMTPGVTWPPYDARCDLATVPMTPGVTWPPYDARCDLASL